MPILELRRNHYFSAFVFVLFTKFIFHFYFIERRRIALEILEENNGIRLTGLPHLNPAHTFLCGQAFRWNETESGIWTAVVQNTCARLQQLGPEEFFFFDTDRRRFAGFWVPYLDLTADYTAILSRLSEDPTLRQAIAARPGIRILRQDPWETLLSFILSANNNIPRIRGIVDRLCRLLGTELAPGCYTIPAPETLARCSVEDLSPIRSGYRAKYLIDAAQKVSSGEVRLSSCYTLPLPDAETELRKVSGVGKKVAQCVLLYGFGRMDAFPVDTWVRRVMAELYPNGLPPCTRGIEGIAQQYLFDWVRRKGNAQR